MRKRDATIIARLAAMPFRNEADVQRFFIPPLLELLGYDVPNETPSEPQLDFRIVSAGRDRIHLKRPDFLVQTNGRTLLVIETKAPAEKFTELDIEQALSYANHKDVRAPLTMLANGRRILVVESDTRHPQLDIAQAKLAERYRDLHLLLSKATLGSTIEGHLRLVRKVGRGAFGSVYEAINLRVKRREAVKIYDFAEFDREPQRRRFRQGAIAHARLTHPNVATFYGTVEYGTELAVRMQFVDGEPLDVWRRKAKPAIRQRVLLLAEAAETIAFAHANDVVHRDLKPSNIMVIKDGDRSRPMIVDFDTAVVVGESTITRSAERLGSFGYIDPEMLDVKSGGNLRDPRSDVYSLGRVLEFLLTGNHPRPGRSMHDLESRIRRATDELTPREQNLLIEVLLPATSERRVERTQTAAAFASDLRAIFEAPVGGDVDARQYAHAVFAEIDALVAAQQLPFEWQNLPSTIRPDEFGRYSPLRRFGELNALYDEGFYSFYVGPVIGDKDEFAQFRSSKELKALRRTFGKELRIDPITNEEDGAANLVIRYFDIRKQPPRETALQIAGAIRAFLSILNPPKRGAPAAPAAPPRDILAEMETWPSRSWGSRNAFKKLAKRLRDSDDRSFAAALLPFLHLLWPEARLTPELANIGTDIAVGTPAGVAVYCGRMDVDAMTRVIEAFRHSPFSVRDFIVIIRREEETVRYRDALQPSLDRLIAEGKAERVRVWNHRDHIVYIAFQLMFERVVQRIDRWNAAMLEEQAKIERTLGAAPVRSVPFRRYELRIDATSLRPESRPAADSVADVGDVITSMLQEKRRLLHVLLGTAGFGKTTSVMRVAREYGLQWLLIPAARIAGDVSNAHSLFETALDSAELLASATDSDRPVWQTIIGPVTKYLTQVQGGIGVIVDGLDESPVIGRSYGLHNFFNFFRRAVAPVIVTMRSDFWASRRQDFAPGKSVVESTVQTLDVIELQPWTNVQIVEAARLRLAEVRPYSARKRIGEFIDDMESGSFERFYGDIPRTPLFLRFILDVLERRDARMVPRRDLFRYWAEQKIGRDVDAPKARGGGRLPIRAGITTAGETIAISMRAMTEAAVAMTEVRDGAVALLPDCSFGAIREAMGDDAPDSPGALALNSLLITTSDGRQRLRFAHRVFQEFFLAEAAPRFAGAHLPPEIEEWRAK